MIDVVLDTNVLVAALRSNTGASARLLELLGTGRYRPHVSAALCLEYESVIFRRGLLPDRSVLELDQFLVQFLSKSAECQVRFRWRPFLPDPGDDLVLEAALAGGARFIVTHNRRHFARAESLHVRAVTPAQFLVILPP